MALHPEFPRSPYAPLDPASRWFPADEDLRSTAYEKLLPPLVARIREGVAEWRSGGYPGASATSVALLRHWFENDHLLEQADGSLSRFRYYFAQREAVETVVWLYDVRRARDKFDLLRFDASGAVSSGMFPEDWPRYVLKMATGAGKTKVMSLLIAWSYFHRLYEEDSELSRNFLVIAPNIIVLDRLRADLDGLKIFFNDPILPPNGYEGRNWHDDFQVVLHIQDDVRVAPDTGNIFLTNVHRVFLNEIAEPSLDDDDLTDYFLGPFGDRPVGKTIDSGTDLGELIREVDELAVSLRSARPRESREAARAPKLDLQREVRRLPGRREARPRASGWDIVYQFAIHTTRKRMIQVQRELKAAGKPFRAFEILNLGRYERQAYLNVSGRLTRKKREQALARKEKEYRELILRAYRAEPLSESGFFHGKTSGRLVVVGPINLPVGRLFVEEVITECRKRRATRVDVLAFEFEMGLFPAVLDEAKRKGIDLAPKTIPPEVFDKRAVEKGQVRFHDVAYIEITPRFDAKNPLTLAVELTDFSVYYSQGVAESITAELKAGKSEVVCDRGQLIKVSKGKNGVVTQEVLTKQWTDWIDYWAVDFDYESRKEIIQVPKNLGTVGEVPGIADSTELVEFEECWTGSYIFENQWQSFRTRRERDLELRSAPHVYEKPGRYTIATKVVDIFGNDTMSLTRVTVG